MKKLIDDPGLMEGVVKGPVRFKVAGVAEQKVPGFLHCRPFGSSVAAGRREVDHRGGREHGAGKFL